MRVTFFFQRKTTVVINNVRLVRNFLVLLEAETRASQLPWEVIEFLVSMYADDATPKLKHASASMKKLATAKRHAMPGGYHVEWDTINAGYSQHTHTLILNNDGSGDVRKKVLDVLHEIQHYNQHVRWDSGKLSYRDSFVKGKKLPPAIDPDTDDGDPAGLYDISWLDITKFWLRRYGYKKAPHEVDARKFADENVDEALEYIKEHFADVVQ